MSADATSTAPRVTAADRPPERAESVWRRALALGAPGALHDPFKNALDLLRTAGHDPSTMAHALTLGRRHLRAHPEDRTARASAKALEDAITFLGVKPTVDDVGRETPA